METNPRNILMGLVGLIILASIAILGAVKFGKPQNAGKNSQTTNAVSPQEKSLSKSDEVIIDDTTTDALTGSVTALTADSITVKGENGEKKIGLYPKTDVFAIDKEKGLIVRSIDEVKAGSKVTVNYTIKSNMAAYLVLE